MLASRPENEFSKYQTLRCSGATCITIAALYVVARLLPLLDLLTAAVVVLATLLTVQALFSSYLMLYAWEHPERMAATRGPRTFRPPHSRPTRCSLERA